MMKQTLVMSVVPDEDGEGMSINLEFDPPLPNGTTDKFDKMSPVEQSLVRAVNDFAVAGLKAVMDNQDGEDVDGEEEEADGE